MPKVTAGPAATTDATAPALAPMPAMAMGFAGMGFAIPDGAPPPMIASNNPDTMVSTGLANNFNGRCESLWLLPRKVAKGKKTGIYELFVELNIRADDPGLGKDGLVTEYLKVDSLAQWVPSRMPPHWDGQRWIFTPAGSVNGQPVNLDIYMALHLGQSGFPAAPNADGSPKIDPNTNQPETAMLPPEDWKGFYAIPGKQNSRSNFMNGTKWNHFLGELRRLGYDKKAPHINWADFRQLLVGVYGTWVRIPFEFKGGAAPTDSGGGGGEQGQNRPETLCLADILDLGPISGKGGPVSVSVAVSAAPAATSAPAPVQAAPVAAAPAPVVTAPAPAQVPAAAAPAPATGGAVDRNDPAAIEAATNEILTQLAASKGSTGATKAEAGPVVYEGVNARGLAGEKALIHLNDNDWMVGDDRTFGYVPEKGLIVPLQ